MTDARTFMQDATQCAARIVKVRSAFDGSSVGDLREAKVYVLTERRWFREQKVQEVQQVGVTPGGDLTIIAKPPLLTFDVVLYHARWSVIPIGMALLVSIGVAIGYSV